MYSTYLILSLINNSPLPLVEHIQRTKASGRIIIRVPRTHDGILLRSLLLEGSAKQKIIEFAEANNIVVRYNESNPYELNCSAPYIYSLISHTECIDNILFVIAVTSMLSGWAYFYLPLICNFIPEKIGSAENDPRGLNRLSIPKSHLDVFTKTDAGKVKGLLEILEIIHDEFEYDLQSDEETMNSILILTTRDKPYKLLANFNSKQSILLGEENYNGEILFENNFSNGHLKPLGIILIKQTKQS